MRMYNNLVQRCFGDCVDDFRSKHLTDPEEKVGFAGVVDRIKGAGVPAMPGPLFERRFRP